MPCRGSLALALGVIALALSGSSAGGPLPPEVVGEWALVANGFRLTARFTPGSASLVNEAGQTEKLDRIAWNGGSKLLLFRRVGAGFWQHYRVQVEAARSRLQGVFSHEASPDAPSPAAYRFDVRGEKRPGQGEVPPRGGGPAVSETEGAQES